MQYYKIPKAISDLVSHKGVDELLVENELFTLNEALKHKSGKLIGTCPIVEVSNKKVRWAFGARFEN